MVYFIHYKQGLWYQSVTPRKPKAETFPGLTPRWVSNPMYIVSKVKQTLHYILKVLQFVSKDTIYTVVIHNIGINKMNEPCTHTILNQVSLRVPVLTLTWEHKQFENQHNAGEFISSFVLWKCLCFLSVSENVTHAKKIPYFLKSWLLFHKSKVWFSYPIHCFMSLMYQCIPRKVPYFPEG